VAEDEQALSGAFSKVWRLWWQSESPLIICCFCTAAEPEQHKYCSSTLALSWCVGVVCDA
jgi:hypothetical protein